MPKREFSRGASERELAEAGYCVTAIARSENRLRDLVGELGPAHRFLVADLTTEQDQVGVDEQVLGTGAVTMPRCEQRT